MTEESKTEDYALKIAEMQQEIDALKLEKTAFEGKIKEFEESAKAKDEKINNLSKKLLDNLLTSEKPKNDLASQPKSAEDEYASLVKEMASKKD